MIEALERMAKEIASLNRRLRALETQELGTGLTDHSSNSTIVGWPSFYNRQIYYKRREKHVWVYFLLYGPSNSTLASFTLPTDLPNGPIEVHVVIRVIDNGTEIPPGLVHMPSSGYAVNLYKDINGATLWTASGNKLCAGQFEYDMT